MECTLSTIGEYAFQGCTGLQSITLPSTVSNIFKYAFDGCHQLNTVCFCGYYNPSMLNGFNDIFGSAPVSDVKVVSSYQGTTFGLTQVTIGTDNECQDATNTQTATNTPDETYTNTQTKTYAPTNTKTNTQTRTYTQNPTNTHYPSNTEQAQQTNDEIAQEESMKEGLSTGAVVAITMVCTILVIALIGFLVYRIALRDKVQEFIKFTEG
ncbi:leucine-rich repeat domain-containing protein [Histomonas meleagridis]|uniref:leucine-rich repeat domain-containing protein n=1 Tax=Histomonas meleagridis TaxID=135588 RepID=UPI003559AC6D|nr:leucine-rich repeat domain-containing protein [Histomonas meleagridis]KAH0803980.1 leucine-rich repeat domain-containing protein [Histomonas meleagridis]